MSLFRRFTHFAAGVDAETMAQCSSAEKSKYSILGTLVYIPLVTGTVAMAFACSYFTRNFLVITAICMIWAGVVFVIERALISGLRPHTKSFAVVIRVIMAIAMSCIITELLVIFFFHADIQTKIAQINADRTEQVIEVETSRINELKADLASRKQILDQKERAYLDEIDGRNGTGIHGYGPSARAKELALEQERAYYNEAKQRLAEEITAASQRRDENVSAITDTQNAGLLTCIVALYELASEERNLAIALILVHIFFLCVELMPLFIKLTFTGTQYYDVLDANDAQKLEALRLTMDQSKDVMLLSNQCQITQQEVALKNKMTIIRLQEAKEKAVMEAQALYETAMQLDEIEAKNSSKVSEDRAAKLKEKINDIFDDFLENH